ncbi:MAG: hypothetical protein NVS1B11_09850 [Terriglobales bacterium]
MNELPKIVHQRLQAEKPAAHPEPGLLNAFAEKALAERERLQVIEHLSRCDDCREVIFLAKPELQAQKAGKERPAAWMRWPTLRWVAAAACVVVVGAAVSRRQERRDNVSPFSPSSVSDRSSLAAPQPQDQADRDRVNGSTARAAASGSPTLAVTGRETAAALPPTSTEKKEMFAKTTPVPRPRYSIARIMPPPVMPLKPGHEANGGLRASDELAPRAQGDVTAEASGAVANTKKTTQWVSNQAMIASPAQLETKWMLSSDGLLHRSLDAGKTWEVVVVANGVQFRAVSSVQSDVWVGGANGSLYHSTDAGLHWAAVAPTSDGEALTTDIVSIDFNDPQRGKLTTAASEVWMTVNGGQTWERK